MPTVVAVDAMGSDRAPKPEVEGAILACRHYDVQVLLVGREPEIREELNREIDKHIAVAATLAHSRLLVNDDLPGFWQEVREALTSLPDSSLVSEVWSRSGVCRATPASGTLSSLRSRRRRWQ